jgi:hypothetical protein
MSEANRQTEKPVVKLLGEDGNVFNIIGLTAQALKRAGLSEQAKEYTVKAFAAGSYDEVLRLSMRYCEVE